MGKNYINRKPNNLYSEINLSINQALPHTTLPEDLSKRKDWMKSNILKLLNDVAYQFLIKDSSSSVNTV